MRNKEKIRWRNIILFIIAMEVMFYITAMIGGSRELYFKFTNVACGMIGFSLGLIAIFKKVKSKYRYIGIGFLIIGIIEIIKLGYLGCRGSQGEIINYLTMCIITIEFLIIPTVIIFSNKKSEKYWKVIALLVLIITFIFVDFVYKTNNISKLFGLDILIGIITIIYCIKREEDKGGEMLIYLICITIATIMCPSCIKNEAISYEIGIMFRLLAYFAIYEGMSKKLIHLEVGNIERKVRANSLEKENIKIELKREREKLVELSRLKKREIEDYYELVDRFEGGIYIHGFNEPIYINKKGLELLGLKCFDEFRRGMLKVQLVVEGIDRYGIAYGKVVRGEERVEVQVYEMLMEEEQHILYLKDMTTINRYKEIRNNYNQKLIREKMKNEFYTNVSHELRTPINVINVAIDLNKIKLKNKAFKEIKETNKTIKRNCLRLIRTINNFIDANKISDGYMIPKKVRGNIVEFVETIVETSYKYIKDIGCNILFDSFEESIVIDFDKELIERVILNLISNGLKHRKKEEEGTIEIDIYDVREHVIILIVNDGKLIDEFEESFLFDEFTRINKSLNRENEGSGLGLYLCKAIIEAHRGEISFRRRLGKNSFIIKLPKKRSLEKDAEDEFNINSLEERIQLEFSDLT